MNINDALTLIKHFEGFREQSYYYDQWTVGYGFTGRDVKKGTRITKDHADKRLLEIVKTKQQMISDLVKVNLTVNQYNAVLSFFYNIIPSQIKNSGFLTHLNEGNFDKAAERLLLYVNAVIKDEKKVQLGLVKRRRCEFILYKFNIIELRDSILENDINFKQYVREKTEELVEKNRITIESIKKVVDSSILENSSELGLASIKEKVESPKRLQDFLNTDIIYSFDFIALELNLARQIQTRLIALHLLHPPPDGKFGKISSQALLDFQELMNASDKSVLSKVTAELLIETKALPSPPIILSNDLASRIIRYMITKGYYVAYSISLSERLLNIVYLQGMNADGSLNDNKPNHFNDRRLVIEINDGIPAIVGNWEGTINAGEYYHRNPMNPLGTAQIKFGQYKAWRVGIHGNAEKHEALVQRADITVYRDANRDRQISGDKQYTDDLFAINQHWGYDLPITNVRNASAGCLLGRTRQGHRDFMRLIKQDKRYRLNKDFLFYTTVINGRDL
jgi:GH24 family phage-related lysozyme (muramidase)